MVQPCWSALYQCGGERGLKVESRKVRNHIQNTSQHHCYCYLKAIWILDSGCGLKCLTHANEKRRKAGSGWKVHFQHTRLLYSPHQSRGLNVNTRGHVLATSRSRSLTTRHKLSENWSWCIFYSIPINSASDASLLVVPFKGLDIPQDVCVPKLCTVKTYWRHTCLLLLVNTCYSCWLHLNVYPPTRTSQENQTKKDWSFQIFRDVFSDGP